MASKRKHGICVFCKKTIDTTNQDCDLCNQCAYNVALFEATDEEQFRSIYEKMTKKAKPMMSVAAKKNSDVPEEHNL